LKGDGVAASPKAAPAVPKTETTFEEKSGSWLWELIRTWAPAVLAVILIRSFVFEPFRIPSGSMVPTLLVGDHVVVTKFSYGIWLRIPFTSFAKELVDLGDPKTGDVIVFQYPLDPNVNYIKRVVGVPGDHVKVRNNRIWLNGVEQKTGPAQDYTFIDDDCRADLKRHFHEDLPGVPHSILTNKDFPGALADMDEITVPKDMVFVMGDNRDNSMDSRQWKFVKFAQIKGKAHRIWLSWDGGAGNVGSIRTERFLKSLYVDDIP
jgi:signal peptidase I